MAKRTADVPRRRGVIADTDGLQLHKGGREQEESSRKRHHLKANVDTNISQTQNREAWYEALFKPVSTPSLVDSRFQVVSGLCTSLQAIMRDEDLPDIHLAAPQFRAASFFRLQLSRFTGGNRGRKQDHMEGTKYVSSMG